MSEPAKPYYCYWGKAKPRQDDLAQYHLLPFHCLDVASVGVAYLRGAKSLLKSCCQLLACSEAAFLSWAEFWLALHDLGKFSEAFQAQRGDLIRVLQLREPNAGKTADQGHARHDTLGFWLWDGGLDAEVLNKIGIAPTRNARGGAACWMRAVTGHHGTPPKIAQYADQANSHFLRGDRRAAAEFIDAMAALLLNEEARRIPDNLGPKAQGC